VKLLVKHTTADLELRGERAWRGLRASARIGVGVRGSPPGFAR
jgi:hypothetical protein